MASPVIPPIRLLLQRWGVHPDSHKHPASEVEIGTLPLPPQLILPLQQHAGAPARALVAVGDHVLCGQMIAAPGGKVSAPVHAPTSGLVVAIGPSPVPHPSGLLADAIVIEPDGHELAIDFAGVADPFALSPAEIAKRVADAGVVGMGGATFPSAMKLELGRKSAIDTLILNGGECEPYLSCDDRLMRERASGIVDGARMILHATGAVRALIAIEDNKPRAIAAMREAARGFAKLFVMKLPSRYPMGSDRQLIQTLTGIEAPADGRAADVGVIVHNVGTAYAVHRAVRHGEPLIRRIVTVAGGAVAAPRNVEALIGTPLSHLLAHCGGLIREPVRTVMGGPMMGIVMPSHAVPVIKGTSGVLALTAAETESPEPGPCLRCGACVDACPVGLMPFEMAARVRAGDLPAAGALGVEDCISCGSCGYVCPSSIPLVHLFYHAKGELWSRARHQKQLDATRALAEARAVRVEREAREKAEAAARRKAERAKAAAAQGEQA
ncbi:electron transport complex subunit RsxC [Niveibacterium terrae]|uniref:electron transport complex subunit RsxC n=1 Tax=Niveibacterium terrae TaxID=3373598 RepID=UPI003A8FAA50